MTQRQAAQKERRELRGLGWETDRIATYMKKWVIGHRLRVLQNKLISSLVNSRRLCRLYGRDLKFLPIRVGLPTISDLELSVYPQHEAAFEAILREEEV